MRGERGVEAEKILSLLGMARRAGLLIIGQDGVKSGLSRGQKLFMLFPEDAPVRSARTFASLTKNFTDFAVLKDISAERLARAIGVSGTIVVALPGESGFIDGIKKHLQNG